MQTDAKRPLVPERGRGRTLGRTFLVKLLFVSALLAALALIVSQLNLRHDMRRLKIGVLSGAREGNYHRVVQRTAELAAKEHGLVYNVASEGSIDNVKRLAAAAESCEVAAGLAQDGAFGSAAKPLLLGRLPKAESVFFLGRNADQITDFAQLAGLRIGIGPDDSGAALIARDLFALPELRQLGATLSHHALEQQLELAAQGELDLALLVMDEDAALVSHAILRQGLQTAGFRHADVIARRVPHLRTGRIGAGEYDAVAPLPKSDKKVLRVETLVIGNGCASRSQTMDLLTLLSRQFPDFGRHNRNTPNTTGLELDPTARDFFERGGPELADQYAPWLVDVMPPANWVYIVMGVSLLFNAMTFGHRFRLWRVDAGRVALESRLAQGFGAAITVGDLARTAPDPARAALAAAIIAELEQLSARSRRYSLSLLVPMGEEMTYRYQEELMHQTLTALREYQQRTQQSLAGG
jgi:hypothetical protein